VDDADDEEGESDGGGTAAALLSPRAKCEDLVDYRPAKVGAPPVPKTKKPRKIRGI
jgi:hypothetical protein